MKRNPSTLFKISPIMPPGFHVYSDFLSVAEEEALVWQIEKLPFEAIVMHGVTAKRRAVGFGLGYSYLTKKIDWSDPLPRFLWPLRERVAAFVGVRPEQFSEAFINEYSPGAAIGWHVDAPVYGLIAGVTFLSPCTFRLRSVAKSGKGRHKILSTVLAQRSAYVMRDEARWDWQHGIPPTDELRYSVTFRTIKG